MDQLSAGVERLGQGHVIHGAEQLPSGRLRPGRGLEVSQPARGAGVVGVAEEDGGAIRSGHRGQIGLARSMAAGDRGRQQRPGPLGRAARILALDGDRRHHGLAAGPAGVVRWGAVHQHPHARLLP